MRMKLKKLLLVVSFLAGGICVFVLSPSAGAMDDAAKKPVPKTIALDPAATANVRLLGGPPETMTMRSGLVVLEPGKSDGTHTTDSYEEVLVVLEGEGKMVITGGPELTLKTNTMAYCPPQTEHNVTNTGTGPLRYVYIVAKGKP
jgi:mannose-6-phosphate isomerase-like protein (cupin superfamily)